MIYKDYDMTLPASALVLAPRLIWPHYVAEQGRKYALYTATLGRVFGEYGEDAWAWVLERTRTSALNIDSAFYECLRMKPDQFPLSERGYTQRGEEIARLIQDLSACKARRWW